MRTAGSRYHTVLFVSVDSAVRSEPKLRRDAAGTTTHPAAQQERRRRREKQGRGVRHLPSTGRLQGHAHQLRRRHVQRHQEGTKSVFTLRENWVHNNGKTVFTLTNTNTFPTQ